ncbi:MAG: hypothetical protein JW390_60017 [Nitrosopumilus sp.]|nr:hypothetical protein [Candidatus Nitrosopumilus limneticus]
MDTDLALCNNKSNVYIAQIVQKYYDSYRRYFPKYPVITYRTIGTKL